MKRVLLQAAAAVALATSASAAMAFNPSTTAPDYKLFISGSSAITSTVLNFTIDNLCDSSQDISVFRRSAGAGYGNDWGVACRVNNATTGAAARNVLFMKRDAGGSGYGVTPVTNGVAVDVMQIAVGAGQNCGTATTSETTPNGTQYNQYICGTANTSGLIPDAGFSDVEPDKFRGINTPAGLPEFNPATALPFTAQPVAALVGGAPVTTNLRNALQAAQFPTSSVCNPANASYAANAETQACMPSLTSAEIRTLFVGGLANWNGFLVTDPSNPTGPKIPLASLPGAAPFVPADNKVEICRRTPGSGTQASFGMVFLNSPCDPNAVPMLNEPGNIFSGPVVAANSGGGDLGRCLDDFNNGTNNSGKNASGTTRWAIGLQFTTENVGLTEDYRYIKINGYAPTIQNVAAGDHQYYAEESFQWRTNINDLHNASTTSDKNDTLTILQYIANTAVTPTALAAINTAYVYPWGQGGWLAIPSATNVPSNPFDINNPVNTSTRAPFGRGPNTCQLPITVKPVQVDSNI